MKKAKRILALLMATAIISGLFPSVSAVSPSAAAEETPDVTMTTHIDEDFADAARYPVNTAPEGTPASSEAFNSTWISDGDVKILEDSDSRFARVTGTPEAAKLTLDFSEQSVSGLVEIEATVKLVQRVDGSPSLLEVYDDGGAKVFSMNSNKETNIQFKDDTIGWISALSGDTVLGQYHTFLLRINTVEAKFWLSVDGVEVGDGNGYILRSSGGNGTIGSLAVFGNGGGDSGILDVKSVKVSSFPLPEVDDSFLSISAPNSTLMESPAQIYGTAPSGAEEVVLTVEKAQLNSLIEYRKWEEQAAFEALADELEYDYDTSDAGKFDTALLRAGTGIYLSSDAAGFAPADAPVEITVPVVDGTWSLDTSGAEFARGGRYLITVKAGDDLAEGSFTVTDQVNILTDYTLDEIFTGPDSYVEQVVASIQLPDIPDGEFVVTDPAYGAKGDGVTDDKPAFDAAIAALKAAGGGTVIVPEGTYLLDGPIWLESNMELRLEAGSVLKFNFNPANYPNVLVRFEGVRCFNYSPLIYAYGKENIAITGEGTIDGQTSTGWMNWKQEQEPQKVVLRGMGQEGTPLEERVFGLDYPLDGGGRLRPDGIQLYECSKILIEGVTIQGSPFWSTHYVKCDNITFRNVNVDAGTTNDDGFDPESSQNVLVENCSFNTADDNIAIKAGRDNDAWEDEITTDVVIRNNSFEDTNANAICMGSEMSGGIYNVFSYDCEVDYVRDSALFLKADTDRGGEIAQIYFKDINIKTADQRNQGGLIFFQLDYKGYSDGPYPSTLREVYFDNITGRTANNGIIFSGLDRQYISNVYFNDVVIDTATETPINTKYTNNIHATNVWINGECMDESDPTYAPIPVEQFGLWDDVLAHIWVGSASLRVFDVEQFEYVYDLGDDPLPEVRGFTRGKQGEVKIVNATDENPKATLSVGEHIYTVYFVKDGASAASAIASTITSLPAVTAGDTAISLPAMPDGYVVTVKSSEPGLVAADGTITFSAEETQVQLVLQITSTTNPADTADTVSIPMIIPAAASTREKYDITVTTEGSGTVTASAQYSSAANPITLTVKANAGYVLDSLAVTDDQGDELNLTDRGNSKYTFQMPESNVSVEAVFVKDGTAPVEPEDGFQDVAEDAWYFDAVEYAVEKGFMAGVSASSFAPDAQLTRAQLAQMLYALEGAPEMTGKSAFTDVAEDAWYADAVKWAAGEKLVSGYGDGTFGPDDALTREQLTAILYAYAKSEGADMDGKADLSKYSDIADLSSWAETSMAWAVDASLIGGMEDGTLAPAGTATRAQVAQIVMNLLEKVL